MIHIKEVKKYIIEYKCDCGTIGECMFKPPEEEDALILTDIQCPMCGEVESIEILKHSSNEEVVNLEDIDLHWPIIIENRIKEYKP